MSRRNKDQQGPAENAGNAEQNQTTPKDQQGPAENAGNDEQKSGDASDTGGRNMSSFVVSVTGFTNDTQAPHQKLMKVKIQYPKDWNKHRFFEDGVVKEVAQETGKTFIELGIATEVTEEK